MQIIGPLLMKNPILQREIAATDRLVDIVEEGFDAGIRFGERVTEGMIALRIKPRIRLVVVGSPGRNRRHRTSSSAISASRTCFLQAHVMPGNSRRTARR